MLELNKIHLGDSYELIKEIPDKSIDLIIIDPPYEIVGGGAYYGIFKDRDKRAYDDIEDKGLDKGIDSKIFSEFVRIMKKINIYIWCNKTQVFQYLDYFQNKMGLNVDIINWHKTNVTPLCSNKYLSNTEYCLYFREKGVKVYGTYESKTSYYITPINIEDKKHFDHPTIKPLEIIKNLIINSSLENDVVLDCFSGSGTTCVACKELNRQFIGIEIDPTYHKISIDRLNGINVKGQTSIFTDFDNI